MYIHAMYIVQILYVAVQIILGLVRMLSDSPQSTCVGVDWGEI